MELDMYVESENQAVEYDGPHHYEYPNMYPSYYYAVENQAIFRFSATHTHPHPPG